MLIEFIRITITGFHVELCVQRATLTVRRKTQTQSVRQDFIFASFLAELITVLSRDAKHFTKSASLLLSRKKNILF